MSGSDERQPLLPKNSAPAQSGAQTGDEHIPPATAAPHHETRATRPQQLVLIPSFFLLVLAVITNACCIIPIQGAVAAGQFPS